MAKDTVTSYAPVTPDMGVTLATKAGEPATHVKVEVWYSKGGLSYFTYENEPRGYSVSVKAVVLEDGPHFKSERFMLFGNGWKFHLKDATRFNAKTLAKVAGVVMPKAPELAYAFATDDRATMTALLETFKTTAGAL